MPGQRRGIAPADRIGFGEDEVQLGAMRGARLPFNNTPSPITFDIAPIQPVTHGDGQAQKVIPTRRGRSGRKINCLQK